MLLTSTSVSESKIPRRGSPASHTPGELRGSVTILVAFSLPDFSHMAGPLGIFSLSTYFLYSHTYCILGGNFDMQEVMTDTVVRFTEIQTVL